MNNVQQWDAWQSLESMTELTRCLWVINRTYRRIFGWTLCLPRWKSWQVYEFLKPEPSNVGRSYLRTSPFWRRAWHIWAVCMWFGVQETNLSCVLTMEFQPDSWHQSLHFRPPKNRIFFKCYALNDNHFGDKVLTLGIKSSNKIINPQLLLMPWSGLSQGVENRSSEYDDGPRMGLVEGTHLYSMSSYTNKRTSIFIIIVKAKNTYTVFRSDRWIDG